MALSVTSGPIPAGSPRAMARFSVRDSPFTIYNSIRHPARSGGRMATSEPVAPGDMGMARPDTAVAATDMRMARPDTPVASTDTRALGRSGHHLAGALTAL